MASANAFAGTPVVAPVPAEPAAPMTCPTFEIGAFYGFAGSDIANGIDKKIDMIGADITAVWCIDEAQSFNIRFGYGFGDKSICATDGYLSACLETDVHTFFLMPGYRYTGELCEKAKWYVGVNAGVANMSVKQTLDINSLRLEGHDSAFGFAYSAELGVRYAVSETMEVFAAYEFFGHEAAPEGIKNQNYHMIRMGVGFSF